MNPRHINYYIAGIFMLSALRLIGNESIVLTRAQYVPALLLGIIAVALIVATYVKERKE